MTTSQKLAVELSKLRSELNKIHLDGHDPNDAEQVAKVKELREKIDKAETEYREAVEKEPEPEKRIDTGEQNELRAMLARTSIVQFIDDMLGNGSADNRKLIDEVRSATRVKFGYLPVDLLFKEEQRSEEDRVASAPTTTPIHERPFLPYLFPQSAAGWLGVAGEMVEPGTAEYPRISGKVTGHRVADGAEVTKSEPTFASTSLNAERFGVSVTYRVEETLRWSGFAQALSDHIREALSDAFDIFTLRGTGSGLEKTTALTTVDASAEFTFNSYLGLFGSGVDGRYAHEASDVRVLTHPDAYAHALGTYNTASGESAIEGTRRVGGGFRTSANLTAKASSKVLAILAKGTGRRNAVAAIWRGVQILEDNVTRAGYGEVNLHTNMFGDFRLVDPSGFARHEIHVG